MPKRYLGRKARLYYATDWDTPTWNRISTRQTLSFSNGTNEVDVSAEDSDGEMWEQVVQHIRSLSGSAFPNDDIASDTVWSDLDAAKENETLLAFAISFGDISTSGVKYRKLHLGVSKFDENYDVKDAMKYDFELKQRPGSNKPTTITVS